MKNSFRVKISTSRADFFIHLDSWSVVTAMSSREFEMIDACCWRCRLDRMLWSHLLYVVNFLLRRVACSCLSFSSWDSLSRLNNVMIVEQYNQSWLRYLTVCCRLFELYNLLFVQTLSCCIAFRSDSRRIDFWFRSNSDDVTRSIIENIQLLAIHEWC